jgi:hypothetical protein
MATPLDYQAPVIGAGSQPVQQDPSDQVKVVGSSTALVKHVNVKHPEYDLLNPTWTDLNLLYAGGWALKKEAQRFLTMRPKEVGDVYQARLARFVHENHMGTALDWYSSELFEEDPHIEPVRLNEATGEKEMLKSTDSERKFYDEFLLNCNRSKKSFTDLFRQVFQYLLLYNGAWVMVDLPNFPAGYFSSLEAQKRAKATDPYITVFSPTEVINWDIDEYGNLVWICVKRCMRSSEFGQDPMVRDKWYFYDRENYQVYERLRKADEIDPPPNAVATLISQGRHVLANEKMVPCQYITLPDGLWLANRAMLTTVDHINTDNALSWALFMSALAMPIVISDVDIKPNINEAGFIQLPQGSDYRWTEPEGKSFGHLSERLTTLTEDIFRAFYLIHQGRSGRATPTAQSGIAKQMDMMPSKDVMKMFGDIIRAEMQNVLNMVSLARKDDIEWDVRGFEFKDDLNDSEVAVVTDAIALNIPSDTLDKEVYKRLARRLVPDANPSIITKIFEEIDKAPNREQRAIQSMQNRAGAVSALNGVTAAAKQAGQGGSAKPMAVDANEKDAGEAGDPTS